MTAWNELWCAVQTVNRASLTSLIAVAAVAATEGGAMAATPRRAGPALEHLFDADLVYKPGMADVVPATDREGVLIGSGDGVVSGSKLRGRIRWTLYSSACLYPAVRAGLPAPAGQHLCKVNPGGVIETEDGAEIWFDANGYGLRGYDPAEPSRYVLTMSLRFNTADSRYAWLNAVLGVWEGRFDERSGRASYTAYVPAK